MIINAKDKIKEIKINEHPCLSEKAHLKYGRVHIPVAPKCNIQCNYCVRKYDCINESRPGVTSIVLNAKEAFFRLRLILDKDDTIKVVGVAGPGDALANDETFELFYHLKRCYPHIHLCISTNGLILAERIKELKELNVSSITITLNTLKKETAEKIYSFAIKDGKRYRGSDAATIINESQLKGIKEAVSNDFIVKINTVLIPGINDNEIEEIAKWIAEAGAYTQNIISLFPQGKMRDMKKPTCHDIYLVRKKAEAFMKQMSHCAKCRSDALGKIGENRDIEYDSLSALFGIYYLENI